MEQPKILVVDDVAQNVRLLEAVLVPRGYTVVSATNGQEALDVVAREKPDLVMLDVQMPVMDGYETCRRLRADPATFALPVVMVTASGDEQKVRALEAGADDFVPKPFDQAELLARVKSLVRIKRYHDTIEVQAAELGAWGELLDQRVAEQLEELERLNRLRRFLSPQLVDLVVSSGEDNVLQTHRREIAALFFDVRGFTAFSEAAEPEEVIGALAEFHGALGTFVEKYEATVGDFAGDGVMIYWNDPLPCPDPAGQAVRLALAIQPAMAEICERWAKLGFDLGAGVGIALGYATLGMVGFEGRRDYTPVGSMMNLAARLCAEASAGDVLINQRAFAAVEDQVETEALPPLTLKGFSRPVPAHRVLRLRDG